MQFTYYNTLNVFDILNLISLTISTVIMLSIGGYTIYMISLKPKKKISQMQKLNTLTWGVAFVLLGFSNIFNIIWQYFLGSSSSKLILDQIATFFFHFAVLIKILNTELIINKHEYFYRGYYFSVIIIGLTLFTLIITPPVIRSNFLLNFIYLIWGTFGVSIYMYTFLFLYLRSEEAPHRKVALTILICPILFVIGMVFQPHNLILYIPHLTIITVVFSIIILVPQSLISIGVILMYTTYRKNFKSYKLHEKLKINNESRYNKNNYKE